MNDLMPELLTFGVVVMSGLFKLNTTSIFILAGIVYILLKKEQRNEAIGR